MQFPDLTRLVGITAPRFSSIFEAGSLGEVINVLLPYIFALAGFVLLGYLILGGFDILTSQGDPKKMASGSQKITYAIVGFIIVFTAYWTIQLIAKIFGLEKIIQIFGG